MPEPFIHFGLIVTGKGEHEFLPMLFRSLSNTGAAMFQTIARTGQRSPITSEKRKLRMVGENKIIPSEDEKQIGLPARFFLQKSDYRCVIVVDDLEYAQRETAQDKFNRYRLAVDTMLKAFPGMKERASVHFMVNMLEAYYFADVAAINQHLLFPVPLEDFPDDVENIVHPKNKLKQICPQSIGRNFDEVEDGRIILSSIRVEHVLDRPETCTWLRTLFAWNLEKIIQLHFGLDISDENLALLAEAEPDFARLIDAYHLQNGRYSEISGQQLTYFGKAH